MSTQHNIKYTAEQIVETCKGLGKEITESIDSVMFTKRLSRDDTPPKCLYICLLSGATPYFSELTKYLPSGYCSYVRASSYGAGRTSGELNLDLSTLPPSDIHFDYILIVDDICDTGKTLEGVIHAVEDYFQYTTWIYTTVLITKGQEGRHASNLPDYAGFIDFTDDFYAGFGLDNQGQDRNLNYIYICD